MDSKIVNLKPKKPLKTPRNLKKGGRELWLSVVRSFDLEEHDLALLRTLCETVDRKAQAERELRAFGSLTYEVRKKGSDGTEQLWELKPHPAVAISRNCAIVMTRLRRELGLTVQAEETRPPRIKKR